jgi:hypothetical protein
VDLTGEQREFWGAAWVTASVEMALEGETAFRSMSSSFERALVGHPELVTTSDCLVAGRLARLRIVGPDLARRIERPLAHTWVREDPALAPQLRIDLWDEAATGVRCDGCPPALAPDAKHQVATASADGRFVVYKAVETRSALDRAHQHLVGWISASGRLTVYERSRPLVAPLLLWLMDRDVQGLHAGLVARDGTGVLIGGPSGSGKSTTALSCVQAGLDYLADDCLGLEETSEGKFLGHSLYGSANLAPDHLERLPWLAPHGIRGGGPWEDKSLLMLSNITPGQLARSASITAVVLPRVVPSPRTTFRPASKGEAVLRLAPSSLFVLPHARGARAAFEKLSRLIQSVPSYWLELGQDLDGIGFQVNEILTRSDGR